MAEPEQPPAEPVSQNPRLKLNVDRLEGPVGTTLTFSASLTGGKNRNGVALWVYRDGKRAATFSSNRNATWTYVAELPGIYKGQAIHKGDNGTIYSDSKLITISASPQPPAQEQTDDQE